MTSAAKHTFTAGPAHVVADHPTNACAYVRSSTGCELATLYGGALDGIDYGRRIVERDANADFIAEAFNVAHETGLTPRQLATALSNLREGGHIAVAAWKVERAELLAALKVAASCLASTTQDSLYDNAKSMVDAAIAKATAGGEV